jgi:5-methylcytosine-specific restriction endonuclease McrA
MKRTEFPTEVRLAILQRAHGQCEQCGASVIKGDYEIDHIVSEGVANRKRELTAKDGRLLCVACHRKKSATDSSILAKAKRLAAKSIRVVGQSEVARRFGVKQEDPDD